MSPCEYCDEGTLGTDVCIDCEAALEAAAHAETSDWHQQLVRRLAACRSAESLIQHCGLGVVQ